MDRFFFKIEISKLALPGVMIMFDLANETRKKGMDRRRDGPRFDLLAARKNFGVRTRFPHLSDNIVNCDTVESFRTLIAKKD